MSESYWDKVTKRIEADVKKWQEAVSQLKGSIEPFFKKYTINKFLNLYVVITFDGNQFIASAPDTPQNKVFGNSVFEILENYQEQLQLV